MSKTTMITADADSKLKRETEKAIEDALAGIDLYEAESVDALFEELGAWTKTARRTL
jgi:hypothetical protein